MKKLSWKLPLFILGTFLAGCARPSANEALAKQLYNDGKYPEAASEWRSMCEDGIRDPDVFYNIGIASIREGNLPEAVLQLEKALRYKPGYHHYVKTQEAMRKQISNAVIPVEAFFLADWWQRGINLVRPGIWSLMGLILLVVAMLRFIQIQKLITLPLISIPGQAMIYLIIGIILLFISYFSYRHIHRLNEGIVFTVCEMKEGPSDQSPFIREVAVGEKIKMLDNIPGWTKVNLLNLDEGWIKNECFRVIDPDHCE